MRIIVANKEREARTKIVGHALHKKLTYSLWEGTSLLKFIYGQLYNGKLTKRYGQPQRTVALFAINRTLAHILPENARTTRPYVSAATMRHAN
jgi:hypothetical protein